MKMLGSRFSSPTMDEDMKMKFETVYGDEAGLFIETLENAPDEIAVISSLIMYLYNKKGDKDESPKDI